jgi:hypothetical protein
MEELLRRWGDYIALGVEVIAALLILVGAVDAEAHPVGSSV